MNQYEFARSRSDDLYAVAFALEAIGHLLGADASEHYIEVDDADGLAHAVVALGSLVRLIGGELCNALAFEEPDLNKSRSFAAQRPDSHSEDYQVPDALEGI